MDIKNFLCDILFPKICLNCQSEGSYLCEDCQATLEISSIHQRFPINNLSDLYFALSYQNPLIKKLIEKLKYDPFIKELAKVLSSLIITHFQLLEKPPNFSKFILIPVPLDKKRLKWRGFNQAEEIGKELAKYFKIPLFSDCLIKIKKTFPQVELNEKERKENLKGAFLVKDKNLIRNKKVLLIDDVYTTGSTMKECAKVLKESGAKEIVGIVIARG